MILGLDVSTSITGATVLDENGEVLYCEAWDTRNKKHFPTMFHKANFIKSKLDDIVYDFNISKNDSVYIEQTLNRVRPGFSSAATLLTLARFNGIVSYLCYTRLLIEPEYIGASTARKALGIKVPRGEDSKKYILNFLLDNEPKFSVEYTKHGNPKPGSYDRADSLVIARAGHIFELDDSKS
jgi:hypothetical protein